MNFLARALVPFAVILVFALLQRYMRPPAAPSNVSMAELEERFSGTNVYVGAAMIVVIVALGLGLYYLLLAANHAFAAQSEPAKFIIYPETAIWWFFPGFAAVTLSWEIVLQIWALFNRRDAELCIEWTSLSVGFNAQKTLRWIGALVVLPIAVLTCLALPMHTAVRQDDIVECHYGFAGCTKYRYVEARRITLVDGFRLRDGTITKRASIDIDFIDGRRWTSADMGEFRKTIDPALKDFIEERTKLTYGYAPAHQDIPPLDLAAPPHAH
jgi:hypothetical protein